MNSKFAFAKSTTLLLVLTAAGYAAEAAAPVVWNHAVKSNIGPSSWGKNAPEFATCGTKSGDTVAQVGMRQTPIDIDNKLTVKTNTAALTFQYLDAPMAVVNTGHVVEVEYPAGSTVRLGQFNSSGPVNWSQVSDEFQLLQFHFHVPSEHTIDGKRADMEMHLVHRNQLGDLAVVGVMMNIAADSSLLVDSLMSLAPLTVGEKGLDGVRFNAQQLLPENRSYYMYTGSLTTPPCTEGVRWFLMRNPVNVSSVAVRQMHLIVSQFPGYEGFPDNNRPIVPSNGRTVAVDRQ